MTLAFDRASPRRTRPPTPLRSSLIHGGVLMLWIALFASAFWLHGVFAWSVGMAYIAYDTALILFVAWQTFELVRGTQPARPQQIAPSVGVVVAAYNEASALPLTLNALFTQDVPPDLIVIADDGSTDETAELLSQRYGLAAIPGGLSAASPQAPGLRWLRLPHAGKAATLNAALAVVDTEVVITVDADTLLDHGAIGAMRNAFSSTPQLVAATGVLTPVCGGSAAGRMFQWFQTYEYVRNFLSRYAWMRLDSLLLISGAFAGFRRDALLSVGGFDADCLVEDYELIHRLRRHGVAHGLDWQTQVVGGAHARTAAPSGMLSFLRQRGRWFGGFLQTQWWYRDMLGDRRYRWLGLLMLPVKAIDTLQPIYGLSALLLLIGAGFSGHFALLGLVAPVIAAKIIVDLAFHLWSVHVYCRWIELDHRPQFGYALLAALAEPFSFQILRHSGAAWGWFLFLSGRRSWSASSRQGLATLR